HRPRRLPVLRQQQAAAEGEVPRRRHHPRRALDRYRQPELGRSAATTAVQERHVSRRVVGSDGRRAGRDRAIDRRAVQAQAGAAAAEPACAGSRPGIRRAEFGTIGLHVERREAVGRRIFVDGNSAAALGLVYGGATVCAWYPITPSSSLAEAFEKYCARLRVDPETGKHRYAIVQAEDEIASI